MGKIRTTFVMFYFILNCREAGFTQENTGNVVLEIIRGVIEQTLKIYIVSHYSISVCYTYFKYIE